jgi:hypothetical protein
VNVDSAKGWIDLYGVGVRAGVITPQISDEAFIRAKLGLPEMSDAAKTSWAKTNGVRQPITLSIVEDSQNLENEKNNVDNE